MAGAGAHEHALMSMWGFRRRHDRATSSVRERRRDTGRVLTVGMSVLAFLLMSSALDWDSTVRGEEPIPRKAVVVVGPTHSLTNRYLGYGRAMADVAEAQGMDVKRIFHPNATKSRVRNQAQGADLFIYVGHGNGWPSSFPPYQEATKNGLGLNPINGDRTTADVRYFGADWLKEEVVLSPNAVVILSHLSYASGNASSGMPIPSRDTAIERVDNFANGFLAVGARVVYALGWQPGADIIDALHLEDASMDGIFRTRYRKGESPFNGWIGTDPSYHESVRTPGAEVHIDPSSSSGYLRAVTGQLGFTTREWRGGEPPLPDTEPPVLSGLKIRPEDATVATGDAELPVFTPNGDGLSDTIVADLTLSERAFVDVIISRDGRKVRKWSRFHYPGPSTITWNGRRDNGDYVGEGTFKLKLTPRDGAGNVGEPRSTGVIVLRSLKGPTVSPALFHAADQDGLADSTRFQARLTRAGTVRWLIRDADDKMVRRGIDDVDYEAGLVVWDWDGRDDAGVILSKGEYTARVRMTRPAGTYGHDLTVRLQPFRLQRPGDRIKRGRAMAATIRSAERMAGKPTVKIKQRGIKGYALKVRKVSGRTFKVSIRARTKGRKGRLVVVVSGTDVEGGEQAHRFYLKVR